MASTHNEDKRDAYARSKSPQKSFVPYIRSLSNDRTKHYDNRYRSRSTSRNNYYSQNYSQNRYRSTSSGRFSYDKSTTPPQNSRSRFDTYKRDSQSYRSPYRSSLHIDPLIDTTLALDIYHSPFPETIILQNTQIHTDHLLDQEILYFLDPVHTPILEAKSIRYNHKTNLNL